MKAIITIINALTADQIQARNQALIDRRDRLVGILSHNIDLHNSRGDEPGADVWHSPVTPEMREKYLAGMRCGAMQDQWISTSRDILKLNQSISSAKNNPGKTHPASIKIAVIDSFAAKDALKARNYFFNRDCHWLDFVGMRTKAAWCREIVLDASTSIDRIMEEMDWLKSIGCELEGNHLLNTLTEQAKRNVSGLPRNIEHLPSVPY